MIPEEPETEGGESNVDNGEREADRPLAHNLPLRSDVLHPQLPTLCDAFSSVEKASHT
jgi:hypothetical protein